MKLLRLVVLVVVLSACSHATAPLPPASKPRFDFQSGFWLNLHQRLLRDAAAKPAPSFDELSPWERSVWEAAVDEYRKQPFSRLEQVELTHALAWKLDTVTPKANAILDPVATIYRKVWWPADDAANRKWIAETQALLDEYGAELIAGHERVYGVPYPKDPRIDVASYGGIFGAYTSVTDDWTPHVVVSSVHPFYQGHPALEQVVHEVSHAIVHPTHGVVAEALQSHARRLGLEQPPRDLWHAILFYNTGELTRRALAKRGIDYVPIGYAVKVYDRGFTAYLKPIETWWPRVIDGTMSMEEAIGRIMEDVAAKK